MNIILFGPPGIGKSTIIGTLKTLAQRAIDLEDIYPSRVRFTLPNNVDNVILGGADLNPKRKYPNTLKVLLYMPQGAYDMRRAYRDAKQPEKAGQSKHNVDDWLKGTDYDYVYNINHLDRYNIAHTLISLLKFNEQGGMISGKDWSR